MKQFIPLTMLAIFLLFTSSAIGAERVVVIPLNNCPPGFDKCEGNCVDIKNNPSFCGDCFTTCGPSQYCVNGNCSERCSDPCLSSPCGANTNCTTDGVGGYTCSCDSSWSDCNGDIGQGGNGCEFNLLTDANNCGSCDNICSAGASCAGGNCQCVDGLVVCNNTCVDTSSDLLHCGVCDNPCGIGEVCNSGLCTQCVPGEVVCNNTCIDTSTDTQHCGECNNTCGVGETCNSGQCTASATCDQGDCNTCAASQCATDACTTEFNACANNQDCVNFSSCLQSCNPGDDPCLLACHSSYPTGVTLYYDYLNCVYCTSCPVDCAGICPIAAP